MEENFSDTEILELYKDPRMKAVMKADLFRYAAVAVLGGFYFDMDVYAYRNLGPLLSSTAVFPKEWRQDDAQFSARHGTLPENEEERWQMGNYAFGAEAGHPLVQDALAEAFQRTKQLLNSVSDQSQIEDFQILHSTGPYMLSEVYHDGLKKGKYGDVNFLAGGNQIPYTARSHGSNTWHKFGKYGEHALAHSWVRRRLATENELAEMLWIDDKNESHDIEWQRGLVEEFKKRRELGEAIIADKGEDNFTGMGGSQSAVGGHQYSDDDLQRASHVFQKNFVRSGKGAAMEIALGNEEYNTEEHVKTLNEGDECLGRDSQPPHCGGNMICEDSKKRGVNVGLCDPGVCHCAVLPTLGTAVGSHQYSSDDLQRAAQVFQKHFVRSGKGVMEIALGNEEYNTEESVKTLNEGDECLGFNQTPRCGDNMICEDKNKGGVDVDSCDPGVCICAVVNPGTAVESSVGGTLQFHVKKPLFQAKKKKKKSWDSEVSQSDEIADQYLLRTRVFIIGAIMVVIGLMAFIHKKKLHGDILDERIHLLTED